MEWTKIHTSLIINRIPDKDILAITKYQLLWAELEEQPDDATALRYMSAKQLATARQYIGDIMADVCADINSACKNRNKRRKNYRKNGHNSQNVTVTLPDTLPDTVPITLQTQIREDKIREDKKEKESKEKEIFNSKRFVKPTVEEIKAYCTERNNGIDAQSFFDFYESKGWKVGNTPMKDWRAAVRTWEKRNQGDNNNGAIDYNRQNADLSKYAKFEAKRKIF